MENILLLYATYSSGTQSASQKVADFLQTKGVKVTVRRVEDASVDDLNNFNNIILASPSWMVDNKDGQPHIHMKEFLLQKAAGVNLEGKKIAIFGLGDTSYAHFCGAVDVMEKYVHDHGGELVQPSLRIDSFYFNEEENTKTLLNWVQQLVG